MPDRLAMPARFGVEEMILGREVLPLHSFLEFCHSLESYDSIEELSHIVTENAMEAFDADRGIFFLAGNSGLYPSSNVDYSDDAASTVADGFTQYFRVHRRHTVLHVRTPVKDDVLDALNDHGASNVLCVPFYSGSVLLGALYLDTTDPGKPFPTNSPLLLKTLGAIVAHRLAELHPVTGANVHARNGAKHSAPDQKSDDEFDLLNIVGRSPGLQSVLVKISRVSSMNVPVLLEGESGTGKDLLARALHNNGDRKGMPFVAVNCGAIPENLLASELFGYERGAFTGAAKTTPGKFEAANGGTLFLDEVSELPPAIQVALLRVLQSGEFFRLGSVVPRTSTARIITATNKRLAECVTLGTFREDLYYRLNVMRIVVPPLRDRREDIPLLIGHFLQNIGAKTGKEIRSVAPAVYALLQSYQFPGNVRELENTILSAAVSATTDAIQLCDLPEDVRTGLPHHASGLSVPAEEPATFDTLRTAQANMERSFIERLLAAASGNVSEAAKRGGVNRTQLHELCARHGIVPALFRPAKDNSVK